MERLKERRANKMGSVISVSQIFHRRTEMKKNFNVGHTTIFGIIIAFAMMIAGCTPFFGEPSKDAIMQRISSYSYPTFSDDLEYNGLQHGIAKSLSYLHKIPQDRIFVFGKDRYDTHRNQVYGQDNGGEIGEYLIFFTSNDEEYTGCNLKDCYHSGYPRVAELQ